MWYHSNMNLLNRDTDYALRAILYIANSSKEIVSTKELNDSLDLPRPFMRKIFQVLQKEGVLTSSKGNMGGFALAKHPKDIYLADIMKIFQGELNYCECVLKEKICPNKQSCPLRRRVKRIEVIVRKEIEGVTLAKLLQENAK